MSKIEQGRGINLNKDINEQRREHSNFLRRNINKNQLSLLKAQEIKIIQDKVNSVHKDKEQVIEKSQSPFSLLSKFRNFREEASLFGILTLAGIMGSCGEGDNPVNSSISQTEGNVKKTPALKSNFEANTLGEIKKIPESEKQKETYTALDFVVEELLLNQSAPEKEKERIKNSLLVYSHGGIIIYPTGKSIPFVAALKKQIEQENLKQQIKMTKQEKVDRLIETIFGREEGSKEASVSNNWRTVVAPRPKGQMNFIIMKEPNDTNRPDVFKMAEYFAFWLSWHKSPDILAEDEEVLKLYQIDTRDVYVDNIQMCNWFLRRCGSPNPDWHCVMYWGVIMAPGSKAPPDKWSAAQGSNLFPWSIKPGSNSPHMAWDNKNQDIVWTDNINILGKASIRDFNWSPPPGLEQPYIIMQLLDTPIPINK